MNSLEKLLRLKNSKAWLQLKSYCEDNFLNELDFFRFEDLQTNFLASLLKPNNIYGLGDYPMRLLLELITVKTKSEDWNLDVLSDYSLYIKKVTTQKPVKNYRLDLVVEFEIDKKTYELILENKLFSIEGEKQCEKYETAFQEQQDGIERIYVYLSLEENPEISGKLFKQTALTYKQLLENVLEPCGYMEEIKNNTLKIEEYIKGFTYLYEYIPENKLPIPKKLRSLALAIYNENKEILTEILENKKENTFINTFSNNKENAILLNVLFTALYQNKIEVDIKDKVREYIEKKLRLKHTINNKGYSNNVIVYRILKDIIEKKKITNEEELNWLLLPSHNGWKTIIPASQIKYEDKKDYYRLEGELSPIKIGEEEYYYCSIVNKDELAEFLNKVFEKYPEYKDLNDKNNIIIKE